MTKLSMKTIKNSNMLRTLGITAEDMHKMIDSPDDPVDPQDLIPYTFPDIKQLAKPVIVL